MPGGTRELVKAGRPQLNPAWGGGHGDGMETSANLAINPESVNVDAYAPEGLRNDLGLPESATIRRFSMVRSGQLAGAVSSSRA